MKSYEVTRIGHHRGRPRLWLEGIKALMGGFFPGKRFAAKKDLEKQMLVLELSETGCRIVSRKLKGEKEIPVIDINSMELLSVFEGIEAVRVVVQQGRIFILPLSSEIAVRERLDRLKSKLESGEPIQIGSLSHGGGVLTHALHSGLKDAGIASKLAFANEIRAELLDQASECNDSWDGDTIPLAAPMQELAFDAWAMNHLPKVEVLEAGLPCSGASVAGRAKRSLEHPEAHPDVGHLVVPFLSIIAKVQPAVILLENVKQYLTSASMCILRNQLRDFGYDLHVEVLQAADWNALEHRERMCMVAVTKGLSFDFSSLARPERCERRIGDILDPVSEDALCWSRMEGLKAKQERDKAEGKGFAMQIVTPFDTKCPTITKGYAKVRSTDPKLQHPSDPDLLRQFTPAEHARIKGIPERLVSGLSLTLAHELLGQSVCYEPFRAVGRLVGQALMARGNVISYSKGTSTYRVAIAG
jgi:DNA (cytosine-5)-methyltransferase 1